MDPLAEVASLVIHPTAVVEDGAEIGAGTRVWHFAHVRSGARIGRRCVLGKSVFVDSGAVIGSGCKIQNFVSVYSGVTLEDDVFVGPSAVFTNDLHPRASGDEWEPLPTLVRRGASIGANATVLCGLTIGLWAMVGAGAVVTKDVGPHRLVLGNPAKEVGWVCRSGHGVPGGPGSACPACGEVLSL
jgi:UDP-2-acetamido-3-amino-2,3-dideoxy-glucuronate N-acetyltransferase